MSDKKEKKEKKSKETAEGEKREKRNYRKDKPWDDGTIDHWKIDPFTEEDNKGGAFAEASVFLVLFPKYREEYLKQVWPDVKLGLKPHGIRADINLTEGSMSVTTTSKTFDPYIIIKAKILLKLLARSVPLPQALRVLDDDVSAEIVKISGMVRNKERFVSRRQRLIGPDGSTLKALELLTKCYILVQGQTVCIMGGFKGIKKAREIVVDCMNNIHPIYNIKELMVRRELESKPELKEENWDKFLPKFKRRNVQRKASKKIMPKTKTLFPPEQAMRKEDIAMETGEYFLSQEEKAAKAARAKRDDKIKQQEVREDLRAKAFEGGQTIKMPKGSLTAKK